MLQALAELMVHDPEVQRWLMKIDDEHLGRGHAYLDVAAIPAVVTALQLYSQTLEQIPGTRDKIVWEEGKTAQANFCLVKCREA